MRDMDINCRALYNSLRMNWIQDPTIEVEAWQVEDYRAMAADQLFEMLENEGIQLDKKSFLTFAENADTPEDLTDLLLADLTSDIKKHEQIYLVVFELWRRFLPEKPSLSVFCDELDYQIHLYDAGTDSAEAIQDALANLQVILDDNVDDGISPYKAFDYINSGCANNLESFLRDFISEQIDNGNVSYASELLDGFIPYIKEKRWFNLLRARVQVLEDPEKANKIILQLIQENKKEPELDLNLELLAFMVHSGRKETFDSFLKQTIPLLKSEEDFQFLISICIDFYHRLDEEKIEESLQKLLESRSSFDLNQPFDLKDSQLTELLNII